MKNISLKKRKDLFIYAKKNFILTNMIKMNLNYPVKQEIIVIIMENTEELLTLFVI